MLEEQLIDVVDKINKYISQQPWLDFEVIEYKDNKLKIIGYISQSYPHIIEIIFYDVFFVSLPIEWRTDTSQVTLAIVKGKEEYDINVFFKVEEGYTIFRFLPEYYLDDFRCLVAAKQLTYQISGEYFKE